LNDFLVVHTIVQERRVGIIRKVKGLRSQIDQTSKGKLVCSSDLLKNRCRF